MNNLEVRWVIFSIAFAFLPLTLLFDPAAVSSNLHPIFSLFKNPLLFFAYAQLVVIALNFLMLGAKAAAFKFYRLRSVVSIAMMALAFVPVYLAGKYSVALAQEFLPESPLPFFVITIALIGISAMCLARALEIWTVPTIALERLARIRSEPITS